MVVIPEQWEQVKVVFDAALSHNRESRADYLDRACAGDATQRAEVQSLLAAYDEADSLIEKPPMSAGWLADGDTAPMTNRRIGPYRILRQVGHGGMADVYLAARADRLYQRFVAIKLVTELDNAEVLRRFRHERQTLAILDQPNIVKLLDAGTTHEGFPYLVMDYVQGQPIDEYCDSHRLSVAERLHLVRTVCAAVHYAHQNLVVHRDLKPGNILVTAEGVPKLLDFGIAKLTRPEYSSDTAGLTRPGLRLMTAEYASPEQVKGEPITTASDVYSLGVLLYRLLTGRPPYAVKGRAPLEYQRAICQTEPVKPSLAVLQAEEISTADSGGPTGLTPASVSGAGEGAPGKLRRQLEGELDAIILMAMRKEPQRRYQSAEQLSEDILRHLTGWPIVACRNSIRYRSDKFIRRHRARVATATAVVLLLSCAVLAALWQARVAEAHRARAERRLGEVRELAHFVIFDLDDALRSGTIPARRAIIRGALEHLDRLGEDSTDPTLEIDRIEGYLKVGDLQGSLYSPNVGDVSGAEASYRKARQLAEAWSRTDPHAQSPRQAVAVANQKLGELLPARNDVTKR